MIAEPSLGPKVLAPDEFWTDRIYEATVTASYVTEDAQLVSVTYNSP